MYKVTSSAACSQNVCYDQSSGFIRQVEWLILRQLRGLTITVALCGVRHGSVVFLCGGDAGGSGDTGAGLELTDQPRHASGGVVGDTGADPVREESGGIHGRSPD